MYLLCHPRNLSRECGDALIGWARRGGQNALPCFKTMQSIYHRVANRSSAFDCEHLYRRLEIPINPAFSARGESHVVFECVNVVMLMGSLMTDASLVSEPSDFLWTQDV